MVDLETVDDVVLVSDEVEVPSTSDDTPTTGDLQVIDLNDVDSLTTQEDVPVVTDDVDQSDTEDLSSTVVEVDSVSKVSGGENSDEVIDEVINEATHTELKRT